MKISGIIACTRLMLQNFSVPRLHLERSFKSKNLKSVNFYLNQFCHELFNIKLTPPKM